jgi:SAM-dependent methyltransferase
MDGDLPVLPDDAFVMLDPAVEILDVEVGRHSLLCHTDLELGMAVPPGAGLLDFVRSLQDGPVEVSALRAQYNEGPLLDQMLSTLRARGFAHVTSHAAPSDAELTRLREAARLGMARSRRRAVDIDLDTRAPLEALCETWNAGGRGPEILLRCTRLSEHAPTLAELARRRQAGALRAHHVVVRAADVRCDPDARESLLRLGAAVEIEGVRWPEPERPIAGVAELARHRIPVHPIMRPDASILDGDVRARAIEWTRRDHLSGLCLRLDVEAISGGTAGAASELVRVFEAVRALQDAIGDVVVTNLPDDEVLVGNTERSPTRDEPSDAARAFRKAYLRWRVPLVKSLESNCTWAQTPEIEDQWVRASEDLLPNHPELLGLRPGSVVVDVCGGLGRVARRLSPAVGQGGVIISIEMRRLLIEQARRFACERGFTNLQFRPGIAQRLPLPDGSMDAAVNEWTGAIWHLGLGPAMLKEMTRVVRPGGRIAVTHRLVTLRLDELGQPTVQFPEIYRWARDAFDQAGLTIIAERVWGQTVPSRSGQLMSGWVERFLPRLVNPPDATFPPEEGPPPADVFLTLIGERPRR